MWNLVLWKVKLSLVKVKPICVTGRGSPQDCDTLRVLHFLGNRITNGGDVSLTCRLPFIPRKFLVLNSVRGCGRPQGQSVVGRIRSNEKSNGLIRNQTHYLPACSIMPQPTMLPCALPLGLINQAMRSGGIAPPFLTSALDGDVASFMPQPFYPEGNSPLNPPYKRPGGSQSQSECYGERNNLMSLLGIKLQFLGCQVLILVTRLTELSRLICNTHCTK
jgi:hypothetical protein